MKLQNLLQKGEPGLTATSTLLGMKVETLDCTGVETLTLEQMTALFSGIPQEWDFAQLGEVFDPETLADIHTLIADGTLHPDCQQYFPNFKFYQHQEQAYWCARRNLPYVLTTGTGSGKSLCYIVPIINDLLQTPHVKGVRAILVYPMNALINSQEEEFNKCLSRVPNCPIRVRKYTGQENLQEKTEIQNNPPQILLTNYVMLELMLTRVHEDKLVESPDLKFLVLGRTSYVSNSDSER